jgi:hypothetical protein
VLSVSCRRRRRRVAAPVISVACLDELQALNSLRGSRGPQPHPPRPLQGDLRARRRLAACRRRPNSPLGPPPEFRSGWTFAIEIVIPNTEVVPPFPVLETPAAAVRWCPTFDGDGDMAPALQLFLSASDVPSSTSNWPGNDGSGDAELLTRARLSNGETLWLVRATHVGVPDAGVDQHDAAAVAPDRDRFGVLGLGGAHQVVGAVEGVAINGDEQHVPFDRGDQVAIRVAAPAPRSRRRGRRARSPATSHCVSAAQRRPALRPRRADHRAALHRGARRSPIRTLPPIGCGVIRTNRSSPAAFDTPRRRARGRAVEAGHPASPTLRGTTWPGAVTA